MTGVVKAPRNMRGSALNVALCMLSPVALLVPQLGRVGARPMVSHAMEPRGTLFRKTLGRGPTGIAKRCATCTSVAPAPKHLHPRARLPRLLHDKSPCHNRTNDAVPHRDVPTTSHPDVGFSILKPP